MSDTVECIKCSAQLDNRLAQFGHQPLNGLAFSSRGHYGTTVFDPMDGSYLEITLCDPCLQAAIDKGIVYEGKPRNHGDEE